MKKIVFNLLAVFILLAGIIAAGADFDPEDLGAAPAKAWVTPLVIAP
ncbi:MAG TPA: hypothetical protein PKW33_17370 [Anaerolineaceae bacterium]|nr:hypothetical protein [Anaerolineaceae bacterium]HPN53371.1 hypothetical protein [Anaerolineaceae bacterium]